MKVLHFKKTYLFAFGCISDALGGLLSSCGAWAQWFAAQGTSCLKVHHFPVAQTVKNLPAVRRPEFDPRVGKIPWRREWPHTPVFVPREFHEQRSLVGWSPWGHRVRLDWMTYTFTFTWDLSFWTTSPALESDFLTTGPPGMSLAFFFFFAKFQKGPQLASGRSAAGPASPSSYQS